MYQKLRKKKLTGMLLWLFLPLIIGAVVFFADRDASQYLLTGRNIYKLSASDIYDGRVVHGSIRAIVGGYASDYGGDYYIIPLEDGTYMGLYLKNEYEDQAELIYNSTVDYLNEVTDTLPSFGIRTRGRIYAMYEDEQQYFYDWFLYYDDMTLDDVKAITIPYVYEDISFKNFMSPRDIWGCLVPVGVCLGISLFMLIYILAGLDTVAVKHAIRNKGWFEQRVEEDLAGGLELPNVIMGDTYVVTWCYWRWRILKLQDIVWAYHYEHTTVYRVNFIPVGKHKEHSIHYILRNGQEDDLIVSNPAQGHMILDQMERRQPHILLGYTPEMYAQFRANPAVIIGWSDQKKLASQKPENAFYDGSDQSNDQSEDDWQNTVETLKFPHS